MATVHLALALHCCGMRYHEVPAPAPIARWVRCIWFLSADGGGPQPVVPDGRLEIVLHRAEPFAEVLADGTFRAQAPVVVSGQLTRPLLLSPRGRADVVGIRFRTAGARDLLGLPLDMLTNLVVPLLDVDAQLARRLERAARDVNPVAALSETLLGHAKARRHHTSAEAVARLARGDAIRQVARAMRTSVRSVERHVRDDTGLSPRTLQQVMRIRQLYALLQSSTVSGADAAIAAGYYDQSHAGRAFRMFAGASPQAHFAAQPTLAQALLSHSS